MADNEGIQGSENTAESSLPSWAKDRKAIVTDELIIQGNLLRWEGYVVQIANISSITKETLVVVKPPTIWERLSNWMINHLGWLVIICGCILALLGMAMLVDMNDGGIILIFGLVIIAAGIFVLRRWGKRKPKIEKLRYLNILTNSGRTYCLQFETKQFRDLVFNFFSLLFLENDKSGNNYYIDNRNAEIINRNTGVTIDQVQINNMINSIINSNVGGSNTQTV
ncbi:MAG: hypothetical protein IJT94_15370 [Oscillibacter sp.]|nr:hypothetical protein [Oscillibacter sp.]